jgi:hypothetical protein
MTMTTNNTELLSAIVEAFAQQVAERAAEIMVRKYPAFDIARFEQVEKAVSGLLSINQQGEDEAAPLTRSDVESMIDAALETHTDEFAHADEREADRRIEDAITDAIDEHERNTPHPGESELREELDSLADQKISGFIDTLITSLRDAKEV